MRTILGLSEFWSVVVTLAVAVVGAARLTRLVTADSYPPMVYLRMWWDAKTKERGRRDGWNPLLTCPWCFGPWATALALLTGWLSDWHVIWFVFWGWLAASYVTSWIVFHDEDGGLE